MQLSKFSNWLYFSKYSKFNSFFFSKNPKICYFGWFLTDLKQVWHIYINSRYFMPAESNAIVQIFEFALFFKIFEIEFFVSKNLKSCYVSWFLTQMKRAGNIYINSRYFMPIKSNAIVQIFKFSLFFKIFEISFFSPKNLKNCWNFEK